MVIKFSLSDRLQTNASRLFLLCVCLSPMVHAEENTGVGEKAAACGACHGTDGKSISPDIPNLAAQHRSYLRAQLSAFKSGERANEVMGPMAAGLSDADMDGLADHFSRLPPVTGAADPKLFKPGQQLYRGGRPDTHTPACMACHGPAGHGNGAANFPALAGQQAGYTAAQLRAYRSGTRKHTAMEAIAKTLQEADIEALASYIQGLHE